MESITALILAAGEGKRMKSKYSKLTHRVCGKAMIEWVYGAAKDAGVNESVAIVGHKAEQVRECMGDRVKYVLQEQQLGTGHAVMQADEYIRNTSGYILVLCGDTPLITSETISETINFHKRSGSKATVITAELADPSGYGRIVRDGNGNVRRIVEHRDASEQERAIREINSGMYLFSAKELAEALKEIGNDNDQGEYYLTDTLEILIKKGYKVSAYKVADPDEVMGVNDRLQLYQASEVLRMRILKKLMLSGVTIIDAASTYIDGDAAVGMDTVVYPGTIIEGGTVIGEDCEIGPNSRLVSSKVGNGVKFNNSIIIESTIGDDAIIGPFAYIRPDSRISDRVKIGDFVEIKKSVIGERTKIPHLTYIGDAEVGENTNIACGVVTVNYDGKKKNKTIIGSNAFVGCNVNLVAPVTVQDSSYIAAGSTITEEVPENSLAIARSRQVIKEDWVNRKGMQRK